MVLFLGVADGQVVSPLLPVIRNQFGKSAAEAGLLFTGYSVTAGVSVLLWGPLSAVFGSRRALLVGTIIFLAGSVLSLSAGSFLQLLAGRMVTGMGASLLSLNTVAYAAEYFPYSRRGWAMSTIFASYFAALILGVPLGTVVSENLGWHAVFALAGGTALLLSGAVAALLPQGAGHPMQAAKMLQPGAQLRTYLGFLRARTGLPVLLSAFAASAGMTGFLAFVGIWLHDTFNLSAQRISTVFLVSGIAALTVSPFAGALSDRVGKQRQFMASSLLLAVTLVVLPMLAWGAGLIALFGLLSLAAAFRQGPMEALVSEAVPGGERTSFIALRNSFSQWGIGLAAMASGALFEWQGYWAVCLLCALLNAAAGGILLWLPKERHF